MTYKPSKFNGWLKIEQSLVRRFDRVKIFRSGFVNFDDDFLTSTTASLCFYDNLLSDFL